MRGLTPARLLMALLASATAFVSAEDTSAAASLSKPAVGKDCCREGYFCCGDTCESNHKKERIFCTLQVNGCCDNPNPHPFPWPRPQPRPHPHPLPRPWPKPDQCCRKGTFCCGDSCLPNEKKPFVRCASGSCCKPKPWPKPWPKPDDSKKCCSKKGRVCCNNRCYAPGTQLRQLCRNHDCGCPVPKPKPWPKPLPKPWPKPQPKPWPKPQPKPWPPLDPKEKCCAKSDRVCCDGNCHPPNTKFVKACKNTKCGCPNDKPKPLPKPPGDCCGRNKVCCGFKCISKWRAKFSKCAKIAGGCCLRKQQKKERRRLRKQKKNKD